MVLAHLPVCVLASGGPVDGASLFASVLLPSLDLADRGGLARQGCVLPGQQRRKIQDAGKHATARPGQQDARFERQGYALRTLTE